MKSWLSRPRVRLLAGLLATAAILVPVGVMWVHSLVPGTYSVMEMGYADFGGGRETGHQHHGGAATGQVSVASLSGPKVGAPDVAVTLTAREEPFSLRSGQRLTGYTLNHSSPGPLIRARHGDLVQVTLVNANVSEGVTLHWHGIDVPNAEDGVAGVTQNAVAAGGKHVYRFIAEDAGSYWYHSHQVSHEQVRKGLFGAFVIDPASRAAELPSRDFVAMVHSYAGSRTINGATGRQHVAMEPGLRSGSA